MTPCTLHTELWGHSPNLSETYHSYEFSNYLVKPHFAQAMTCVKLWPNWMIKSILKKWSGISTRFHLLFEFVSSEVMIESIDDAGPMFAFNHSRLFANIRICIYCITLVVAKAEYSQRVWSVQWLLITWWRHQMETFSALLAICAGNSPVTGEFPAQRPVTRSFDVFFNLRLNKRLSKRSWGWWFETPLCSLWRHCNGLDNNIGNGCIAIDIDFGIF